MEVPPVINLVAMAHLIFLSLWGGVVAAESVMELLPFRKKEFHGHGIELHYWIDLLVETPLIVAVIATGATLVTLAWPLSTAHVAKICCALVAVSANLTCVVLVVRRRRLLQAGADDEPLWRSTRRIALCAVAGLPFAALAAGLGFWLAYQRMI